MCGFVAIHGAYEPAELQRMATAVSRRGPDDQGQIALPGFGAVHHRLSIIGPDERGRQPMTRDEVTVVFNGCIYNYPELRARLEKDGVTFNSDADTEVLPHLFRRFGMGMFSLLNGMFSIVLWDAREQLLVVARDAFGEKPLFICEQNGRIGMASLLSAFEQGGWQLTPDIQSVYDVLTRMRVEAPRTMYQEVQQLPAGCYAVARMGEPLQLRRYFFLPEADQPLDMQPDEVERACEILLDEAFRMRTMADKPMGVFLSGGVDSSLIAAMLSQHVSQLHTFSVRFADGAPDYDESAFATRVAQHIGAEHKVLEVRVDARATLHELAQAFDQPVTNAAALPTYLLSREAKAYVDVALSGVGGDELFGGYPRYLGLSWHRRLQAVPGRGLMLKSLQTMGDSASSRNRRGRLRRFLEGLNKPADEAYGAWIRCDDTAMAQMLTRQTGGDRPAWPSAADAFGGLSELLKRYGVVNGGMAYDVLTYLPDDLLAMGDRMSMAHALELRAPFLDTRLLTMLVTLPANMKVAGAPWQENLKIMLKRIAARHLPHDVVYRPKQGFMAPVKHWLRGDLATEIEAMMQRPVLGGLVQQDFVREQWLRHQAGQDRSDILWGLLVMDAWMGEKGWKF